VSSVLFYAWFTTYTLLNNDRDIPKGSITLSDDPNQLPFFPTTHMFIKKIECLAVRKKDSDREDLIFLFENFPLDWGKINKKVSASQRDAALDNYSNSARVVEILGSLDIR
jgi:hypothetical protein